jgi:hypothetical protein
MINKKFANLDDEHQIKARRFVRNPAAKGHYILSNKLPYTTMRAGHYFGGRVLLYGELPADTRNLGDSHAAKFSVVADSANVEVYILTKYHIAFLAERTALRFLNILRVVHELDCPSDVDIQAVIKDYKAWEKGKQKLINNL